MIEVNFYAQACCSVFSGLSERRKDTSGNRQSQ